ncbi:hypothetical protein QMK33_06345 [Hymenobacter sp. H14-R3]|uniref:hypothetical protein n=1 Tax=Hymenobacter sp. H14-R3 TaxID=3046308 RepID=UPI0024BB514B|nr:hypothetical protein [Hymenobacter sp. H14-R3]MDJ0364765.1 hypothetical protein [Hymenobacter sp. H14-R3]
MMPAMFEADFARLVAHRRRWLAGLCLLVAATFQLPKVNHAYAQLFTHTEVLDEKLRRIGEQAAAPFAPHADHPATHLAKMSFRLAVPPCSALHHAGRAALPGGRGGVFCAAHSGVFYHGLPAVCGPGVAGGAAGAGGAGVSVALNSPS